jgi:hypothetical protein
MGNFELDYSDSGWGPVAGFEYGLRCIYLFSLFRHPISLLMVLPLVM